MFPFRTFVVLRISSGKRHLLCQETASGNGIDRLFRVHCQRLESQNESAGLSFLIHLVSLWIDPFAPFVDTVIYLLQYVVTRELVLKGLINWVTQTLKIFSLSY